jgi:hypothetical protein
MKNYNYRFYTLLVGITCAVVIAYLFAYNDVDRLILVELITGALFVDRKYGIR